MTSNRNNVAHSLNFELEKTMNKLIIALTATLFAGSVMAADTHKADTKMSTAPAVTAAKATEKPADAPKTVSKHHHKKVAHHSHKKSAT
jgi:hypothetical protein